ncbi:TetR/AcrR family transcriptional regulator [Actinomadura macra]|uniref:TetR/AcrR family transcriptional regulator n=1 Tax=Actinomadura macra TaxID=46164 RepID=UPI00082D2A31|nr:TetR/AcrR family transcriptional regulator [Actinomadura macra]
MVRTNPERRAALLDAAIELLAQRGARGVTYRALDAHAGMPTGTALHYFRNRKELLHQIADRVLERYRRREDQHRQAVTGPLDRDGMIALFQRSVRQAVADPTLQIASIELALEAARTPDLQPIMVQMTRTGIGDDFTDLAARHSPGDTRDLTLMYMALHSLVTHQVLIPGALPITHTDDLVAHLIGRLIPDHHPQDPQGTA